VFANRSRNRIKILCFDGTGCWVSTKRLEQGTFSWPKALNKTKLPLKPEALGLLLDGFDLRGPRLRPWYERKQTSLFFLFFMGYAIFFAWI
jgi:transposase